MDEQTARLTKVMELRASQERAERSKSIERQKRAEREDHARSPEGIEARRQELNHRWETKYDHHPPMHISREEHEERDRLNRDWRSRQTAPKPPAPQPRAARPTVSAKGFKALGDAAADVIAREIADMRRERDVFAAQVGEALARVDAALARLEAKG